MTTHILKPLMILALRSSSALFAFDFEEAAADDDGVEVVAVDDVTGADEAGDAMIGGFARIKTDTFVICSVNR
jgi:hypothetical protein